MNRNIKKLEMRKFKMTNYAKAYTEVLELLRYLPIEEYSKIPEEKINRFKENMDKYYEYKIDPNTELSKQNIYLIILVNNQILNIKNVFINYSSKIFRRSQKRGSGRIAQTVNKSKHRT